MIAEGMLRDFQVAFRALARRPGPTLVAVVTLAVGLGSTISIFTFFNAVFVRPLPFAKPREIVQVWKTTRNPPSDQAPPYSDSRSPWMRGSTVLPA